MSKRSFYRSVLTVTVLSEEPLLEEGDLCDINTLITVGGCSGKVETTTVNEVVDGPTMATLLQEQDSDPEFLGLDEDGNDLEEEQEKEGEQNEEEDQDA